jgi:hypothetical protein
MDLAAEALAPLAMVEVWLGEEEFKSESIEKACRSNYPTVHLGQPAVPDMCTLSILVPCELLRRQLQRAQQDMWEDARLCPSLCSRQHANAF